MTPLTQNNVESELSYAYLHAVASRAGASCSCTNRHEDNAGVDARLVAWGPFVGGGYRHEVDLKIQLKATTSALPSSGDVIPYQFRGIPQYDDLRSESLSVPRILVVLFLPQDPEAWIAHTEDALSLRKCAYWASLRGAPASSNDSSQVVHLPRSQRFDVDGLKSIFSRVSRNDIPRYIAKGEGS